MPRHLHIAPQPDFGPELLLAALVDLGASPEALRDGLRRAGVPGADGFDVGRAEANGEAGQAWCGAGEDDARSVGEARCWLAGADLPRGARRCMVSALARLEESGSTPLLLLASCALALDLLDVSTVTSDPLPLAAPVAAATLAVLRGAVVRGVGAAGEPLTPLGAALAVSLADSFGPFPPMTLEGDGLGLASKPGGGWRRLRLYLGRPAQGGTTREPLLVLEANLDDLTPEVLATLPQTCLEAGALDAWLTPALMKKGRPAHCLHALCGEPTAAAVEEAIFRHSSTLGVRRLRVERDALARAWEEVDTPWGPVRVKIGLLAGEPVNRAPEFEDCRSLACEAGVPLKEVYAAALAALRR